MFETMVVCPPAEGGAIPLAIKVLQHPWRPRLDWLQQICMVAEQVKNDW